MSVSRVASSVSRLSVAPPALPFGDRMPIRQLRAAIKAAPEVWVTVLADGTHCTLFRVTKSAALGAIRRIRRVSRTVRADMVFGALVIG